VKLTAWALPMPAAQRAAAIAVRFSIVLRISILLDFGFSRDASGVTAHDPALVCRSTRVARRPARNRRAGHCKVRATIEYAELYAQLDVTSRHFA
jgi:hypothetical protein